MHISTFPEVLRVLLAAAVLAILTLKRQLYSLYQVPKRRKCLLRVGMKPRAWRVQQVEAISSSVATHLVTKKQQEVGSDIVSALPVDS